MRQIFDISMTVSPEVPVYKNRPEKKPDFEVTADYERGVRETRVHMDVHTGTHIDAPKHVIPGGAGIDTYPLKNMVSHALVVDFTHVKDRISAADLAGLGDVSGTFLLLKTRNSFVDGFDPRFVFVDKGGAQFLVDKKIAGVGIDALGIERSQPGHQTHKILLENGIPILEGLRLGKITAGRYTLVAAPLKLADTDASPVRALLIRDSSSPGEGN